MAKAACLPIFLKAIHIQGFKSFADKVKLELQNGMSVIVGPNGSGKSNVADAVRWVLGEQSAKNLRGTKMEDVIFSGSSGRRPVGMAEVSLIFDNSTGIFPLAFQEVTIGRRVYRDGEGQYFINKASCRLKDIQELLLDTGIGKEGFSIIGQGRVEELLNLKSEERRTLIEEASGISKYRARKKEATKRLEETEHNLERLEDIMREIEGQLAPLSIQAELAKKSLSLASEQKQLEINLIAKDLNVLQEKLSSATSESDSLKALLTEIMGGLAQEEAQNLDDKLVLNKLEEEVQQKQAQYYQCEQSINSINHNISLKRERLSYHNEQIQRINGEIKEGKSKQEGLAERIKSLEGKSAVLQRTLKDAKVMLEENEKKLLLARQKNGEHEAEQIKSELFSALSEQTKISNEVTAVRHSLETADQQLKDLHEEEEARHKEVQALRHSYDQYRLELDKSESVLQENSSLLAKLEKNRLALNEDYDRISKQRTALGRQIDLTQAKLQALQALDDSLEGYYRGVREAMSAKKRGMPECSSLCGTIADLLQVEEKYELAIETALGAAVQNIASETMEAAKQAVTYLKKHQLGRATFLPLDVIKGGRLELNKLGLNPNDYLGLAVDLVKYDSRYQSIMESLLGRIIIVRDIDSAVKVANKSGYRAKIVSLDGEQINPGGALTGGSVQKKGASLLGRAREISELQVVLKDLQNQKNLLDLEQQSQEDNKQELQKEIQALTREGQELKEKVLMLRANGQNQTSQILRIEENLSHLELRQTQLNQNRQEYAAKQEVLVKRLDDIAILVKQLQEKLNLHELMAKQAAQQAENILEVLTQEKVRLAKWEQEFAQTTELLQQDLETYKEIKDNITKKLDSLAQLELTVSDIQQEVDQALNSLGKQQGVQEENQKVLFSLRETKESLAVKVISLEDKVKAKRQDLQTREQKLHSNELKIARLETEWEALTNRLIEEHSLTWQEAVSYLTEEDRSWIWERIQAIKAEIESLGPINQAAIEEYPKMAERYDFLKIQEEDLVKASESLKHLIDELDKTMSERFAEGFARVNEAFKEVFREMFNGGSAELRLDDPDNLLDTGVQIIAQPPGKKPQLLSLLSGGERALTAIALLFALLRVKPSPICILDEIEA
ncbi:MAG: chromosome segregation protein SMC, partial [Desulfitobacterium hafniense]|nr:chromosome segregation protein SMC [Desulfitobacterium hafniense]